jgi:hypothetical protein
MRALAALHNIAVIYDATAHTFPVVLLRRPAASCESPLTQPRPNPYVVAVSVAVSDPKAVTALTTAAHLLTRTRRCW